MKSICQLNKMKQLGEKIAVLTAYDASFARLLSEAGTDVLLIGDSLGSVIAGYGYDHSISVTLDDIEYHTRCVARGNKGALLMADMPFMTYTTPQEAIKNAGRLFRAGAAMVKLEGGQWLCETIEYLTVRGIPVCGHIGLTAQYIHSLGGYKIQGRDDKSAALLMEDALALEQAGASLLVIECVPESLAGHITERMKIPTIGIGAGRECNGQVLVTYDMLGISGYSHLTFVKNFLANENTNITAAVKAYIYEVKNKHFPAEEHCFK